MGLVNGSYCKQILCNRKKFKNFDESGIGMPNENLTNSNNRLAFNFRKLKKSKAYNENIIFEWYDPYCVNSQ